MIIQLKILAGAELDIFQAHHWYESQRKGLGEDFLLCVEASLRFLKANPQIGSQGIKISGLHEIRRIQVRRFPFTIYYIVRNQVISILAVLHHHRNPNILEKRI